ncbi:MAG: YggU family protein [Opitutales bacterium]|nr:YggU family protein [Opitutales bacterium]
MARVKIRVVPNAPKTKIDGLCGCAVKIRLNAPPVDGKANEALVKFLSKNFGIPRAHIKIVSGQTSRDKILELPDSANLLLPSPDAQKSG